MRNEKKKLFKDENGGQRGAKSGEKKRNARARRRGQRSSRPGSGRRQKSATDTEICIFESLSPTTTTCCNSTLKYSPPLCGSSFPFSESFLFPHLLFLLFVLSLCSLKNSSSLFSASFSSTCIFFLFLLYYLFPLFLFFLLISQLFSFSSHVFFSPVLSLQWEEIRISFESDGINLEHNRKCGPKKRKKRKEIVPSCEIAVHNIIISAYLTWN